MLSIDTAHSLDTSNGDPQRSTSAPSDSSDSVPFNTDKLGDIRSAAHDVPVGRDTPRNIQAQTPTPRESCSPVTDQLKGKAMGKPLKAVRKRRKKAVTFELELKPSSDSWTAATYIEVSPAIDQLGPFWSLPIPHEPRFTPLFHHCQLQSAEVF